MAFPGSKPRKHDAIVIVGAGVFGLSLALELNKRGFKRITVLDRSLPPVIDGSSVDINRIIRTDYADPLYAKMAQEAVKEWKSEFSPFYHHSGLIMLSDTAKNPYVEKVKEIAKGQGKILETLQDAENIKKIYPTIEGDLSRQNATHNPNAGWADAESSIQYVAKKCSQAGVSFITGQEGTVISLERRGSQITGVRTAVGSTITAPWTILATGAWTNRFIDISHATTASGQPVGFLQLSPEEVNQLGKFPVMINMTTGLFCFPPTPDTHVLKVARHGFGYGSTVPVEDSNRIVSSPKRDGDNVSASFVPNDADEALRAAVKQFFPRFLNKPWMNRRLCWYSDTPEGDFVADHHSKLPGLFLATGGAGHAFKFLPILGRYTADCFERVAPEEVARKWRLREPTSKKGDDMAGDGSRGGPPRRVLSAQEQAKL